MPNVPDPFMTHLLAGVRRGLQDAAVDERLPREPGDLRLEEQEALQDRDEAEAHELHRPQEGAE